MFRTKNFPSGKKGFAESPVSTSSYKDTGTNTKLSHNVNIPAEIENMLFPVTRTFERLINS